MIQAKSLSNVVSLADNPPVSFHTLLDISEPLVLYIARVPGSRGSTSEEVLAAPLLKVVTAQDVQSSLYYIHVDSQDDDRLYRRPEKTFPQDPTESISVSEEESSICFAESLLEGPSPSGHGDASRNIPAVSVSKTSPVIRRKPINQGNPPVVQATQSTYNSPGAQIMGPRSMHPRLHSVASPGLKLAHGKENLMPRRWSEQPPIVQPLTISKPPRNTNTAHNPFPGSHTTLIPRTLDQEDTHVDYHTGEEQPLQPSQEGLSLTLIRRYDGSQWNVGKIYNAYNTKSYADDCPSNHLNNIAIHISTAGYARFHASRSPEAPSQLFERHLVRFRRRSQGSDSIDDHGSAMNHRSSRMSIDFRRLSKPRVDGALKVNRSPKRSPDDRSSRIKGYGFYSPWNGTCEFSSGVTGNALKCKHTAPAQGSPAVTVSELRFNLPSSGGPGSSSPNIQKSPERRGCAKRNSYLMSKPGSEASSTEAFDPTQTRIEDEDDHFDLSLGQEKAGGGFGGKQAKLGKLIIEPEGLKMLDLIVAANMGLWWKAYEKPA
ncbi:MAG: hypothetical protein Q9186_000083 [Xanthomendoza sp. 1 TL-2023]